MIFNRRRKAYKEKRKPYATESVVGFLAGTVTLLLFVIFLITAAVTGGNVGKLVSAISVLSLIVAVVAMFYGLGIRHNDNFDKVGRIVGAAVPMIAVLCWIVLYITGIIVA